MKRFTARRVLRTAVALAMCAWIGLALSGCQEKLPGIGQPASNGDITLTVKSMRAVPTITNAAGFTWHEGKAALTESWSVLLVEFAFENSSANPVVFDPESAGLEKTPAWYRRLLRSKGGPRMTALRGYASTDTPDTELDTPGVRTIEPGGKLNGWLIVFLEESMGFDTLVYRGEGEPVAISLGELPSTPSEIPPLAKVGEPAAAGGMEATVKKVSTAAKLKGAVFTYTPPKGSEFLVLDVQVKNIDRDPVPRILWELVTLRDSEGVLYQNQAGSLTGISIPGAMSYGSGVIKPGKSVSGKLVFVVDKGAEPTELRFPIGTAGPPLAIDLR